MVSREALTPVFAVLNRYDVTTHFNDQSTIDLDGGRATGESYTIAHTSSELTGSKIMIASLRYLDTFAKYLDTFAKIEGAWYFQKRKLILDWSEA